MAAANGGVAVAPVPDDLTAIQDEVGQITHSADHLERILQGMAAEDIAAKPTSMEYLLSAAGRSFLRAFGASLIVVVPGLLAAPDLKSGIAIGVAAVVASIAAGLRAVQEFIPQLSIGRYMPKRLQLLGKYLDSFVRGFLAAFLTSIIGILSMPTLSLTKSLIVGALVGAGAAGLRAVQGVLLDKNESPRRAGVPVPIPRPWKH